MHRPVVTFPVIAALFTATVALPTLAARPAEAKVYSLEDLLDLAKQRNPGLAAGVQATAAIEAQLMEARRSYYPSGDLLSIIAPAPNIRCETDKPNTLGIADRDFRQANCDRTNVYEARPDIRNFGMYTRTEVRLTQPIYTFGKLTAGVQAAEAGIQASRSRESGLVADLELNIRRAYYGFKLARELESTINEGVTYLDEAQKRIEKELAEGTGTSTVTDKLRMRTVRADIDSRLLEAQRGRALAINAIRALIGPDAPEDIDLDDQPLEALAVPARKLAQYEEQARLSRPEVRALDYYVDSKRALADLEWRKQLPDFVIVASGTFAYASSVDNPKNAFASDPFNTLSGGLAAALRMPLDIGPRNARSLKVRAEAEEAAHKRREALGGIAFEVAKAYGELTEAAERIKVTERGEKAARAWITAVSQNMEAGLAEARDFSDALVAFFQMRLRFLTAVYDHNIATAALSRAAGGDITAR